jgi:lysozyme
MGRIKIEKPRKVVAGTALVALLGAAAAVGSLNFISAHEGEVRTPYGDVGGVKTVCFGHTGKDIENRAYSAEECDRLFSEDALKHALPLAQCVNDFSAAADGVKIAFLDTSYNAGPRAICRKLPGKPYSVADKYNAGDRKGACDALLDAYPTVGGVPHKALLARRERARQMCMREE